MLPSEYPEVLRYNNLKRLLQAQVDMQFEDLRTLFLLPQGELAGGCNFTASAMLFNIIAGSSVCLYDVSEEALTGRSSRGSRFKNLLSRYYPWEREPVPKEQAVEILYDRARNPLAHSLGLDATPSPLQEHQIILLKSALDRSQVLELENSVNRPSWTGPTISAPQTLADESIELKISVPTLYWGVHRMLRLLLGDASQASNADTLAAMLSSRWDKYVADAAHVEDGVSVGPRSQSSLS